MVTSWNNINSKRKAPLASYVDGHVVTDVMTLQEYISRMVDAQLKKTKKELQKLYGWGRNNKMTQSSCSNIHFTLKYSEIYTQAEENQVHFLGTR